MEMNLLCFIEQGELNERQKEKNINQSTTHFTKVSVCFGVESEHCEIIYILNIKICINLNVSLKVAAIYLKDVKILNTYHANQNDSWISPHIGKNG